MLDFYVGWTFALLFTVAWCVFGLALAFFAGAEWKRHTSGIREPGVYGETTWRTQLGIAVVLELILVLWMRYT